MVRLAVWDMTLIPPFAWQMESSDVATLSVLLLAVVSSALVLGTDETPSSYPGQEAAHYGGGY